MENFSLPRTWEHHESHFGWKEEILFICFSKESTKNENESALVIDEKKLFPQFHNLDIQASLQFL